MDWHALEKMKVTDLREMAKEKTQLEGVIGMSKDDLVEALAKELGIDRPHKIIEAGTGKRKIKAKIRELKVGREEALATKNSEMLRKKRREIRKLKRKLRRMATLSS